MLFVHNLYRSANNKPFITWLVDAYTIDKAKYYKEQSKHLDIPTWALNINPYMQQLKTKQPSAYNKIISAMKAYSKRILTRLILTPKQRIDDDVNQIVNYVACFPKFINTLMDQKRLKASPPFCVCKTCIFS